MRYHRDTAGASRPLVEQLGALGMQITPAGRPHAQPLRTAHLQGLPGAAELSAPGGASPAEPNPTTENA